MPIRAALLLLSFAAAPALAAAPRPATVIVLTNFDFKPSVVEIRSGVPTALGLRNASDSNHSFSAPALFASARLDGRTAALVHNGRIEVPARSEVDVSFTAAPGSYRFKCTHTFHAMLGMTGTIVAR